MEVPLRGDRHVLLGEGIVTPAGGGDDVLRRAVEPERAAPGRGQASTQQPVKITDRRGYQPDFAWYPRDRFSSERDIWRFVGVPGLIVEVLSPSTRAYDLVRKRDDYAGGGASAWMPLL